MADIIRLIDEIRNAERESSVTPEIVADVLSAIYDEIPDKQKFLSVLTYLWFSKGTEENPQLRINFRAVDGTETSAGVPMASDPATLAGIISYRDYTRFNAAARLFQELWKIAVGQWGGYDADTDRYTIDDLTLTYQEALKVYQAGAFLYGVEQQYSGSCAIRCNLPPAYGWNNNMSLTQKYDSNSTIEVAILANHPDAACTVGTLHRNVFRNCSRLRRIATVLRGDSFDFAGCTMLEDVRFNGIQKNSSFADCPNISANSLSSLISNSAATALITVTVHPDVYAKITGTYDWSKNTEGGSFGPSRLIWESLPAFASEKHITFTTA